MGGNFHRPYRRGKYSSLFPSLDSQDENEPKGFSEFREKCRSKSPALAAMTDTCVLVAPSRQNRSSLPHVNRQ